MNNQQNISESLRFQEILLETFFSRLTWVSTASAIVTITYSFVLINFISSLAALLWCSLTVFINALRFISAKKFIRDPSFFSFNQWIRIHSVLSLLIGMCWGFITVFTINKFPMSAELVTLAYLTGMVAGGAVSNIAHKRTAIIYVMLFFVPYLVKLSIESRDYYIVMVIGVLALMFILVQMIFNLGEILIRSIKLSIDRENLLEQLSDKFELEQQLQQEKIKALQSSKLASLGELAAGVAHEINNPLTIAIGRIDLLIHKIGLNGSQGHELIHQLTSIRDANRRVASIVLSMRNLSRLKDDVELQNFTLKEFIEIVSPLYEPRLTFSDVKIEYDLKECIIHADKGEVSQVLLNLINNSIDAVKGEPALKRLIRVYADSDEKYVLLKVENSGELIPQEIQDKIFEPFFTSKKVGEGTGLGLSLSRNIMERNGGSLYLDKQSAQKTVFVMKLQKMKQNN